MMLAAWRARGLLLAWWAGLYLPPDRRVLERTILPALAREGRRTLFVGVRFYTRHYPRRFQPAELVTLDCDPQMRRYGANTHWIDRLENLVRHAAPGGFGVIVLNGVIGWGLDAPEAVNAALHACADALADDGWLVLGLNERRAATPRLDGLEAWRLFTAASFPGLDAARVAIPTPFDEREHTFLFFRRRARSEVTRSVP